MGSSGAGGGGGPQGGGWRGICATSTLARLDEGDELIQANVTKEMAFKEGWEVGNMGPKKLILILRVQPNSA